jgi:BirA family biotin operon repressor/biotin-[acetyl-CoA-carboxylase] ligase
MLAAGAVLKFFNNYIGDEARVKWPNDIYWRDRKAAGILIENVWQGNEWKFAVIGIGINVNQTGFGELGTKAVSIKQITGKEFMPVELARELCTGFQRSLEQFLTNPGIMVNHYKSNLYKLGETVRLKKENRIFDASIKDVNVEGQLVVQTAIEEKYDVGEVEWLIND